MKKQRRAERAKRPQPSHTTDYPSLEEHLVSRRDVLTWMGASLVTVAASTACVAGDDDSGPAYYTLRLPSRDDAQVSLTGGGTLRFYVTAVLYDDYGYGNVYDSSAATEVCSDTLAHKTHAEIAAGLTGTDGLRDLEHDLEQALVDYYPYVNEVTATLTIVSLTA